MKLTVVFLVVFLHTTERCDGLSLTTDISPLYPDVITLGSCPRSTGIGICVEKCSKDDDCPGGEKCCSNGCGHVCKEPPEFARVRPGSCPIAKGFGICVQQCDWDDECPGKQKCCSNGCGHVCMHPVKKTKPTLCLMCCGPPPCCNYCK